LIRTPRTLPRIITPDEVDALFSVLRTLRDRAMVEAMILGGLRRCEVLALRLTDLKVAERRVFICEGKGGTSGWCPSRPGSSRRWRRICVTNAPRTVTATGCSSCSKGPTAVGRCRRPASMRSSAARDAERVLRI
jgi:integrase